MTRFGYVMTAYFGSMATIVTAFIHPAPRLIWNASASVPIGLYSLGRGETPRIGDLVAVMPPADLAVYLARRHYLPFGVPLLKHVAAGPGQRVCRIGQHVIIDGHPAGDALARDRRGRPLPVWRGCRRLSAHQVFLMNRNVPDSFDSRYFGALPGASVTGRLIPVWTR